MNAANLNEQIKRVKRAMRAFRKETTIYKKMAKGPPRFLLDGTPEPLKAEYLNGAPLFSNRFELLRSLVTGGVGAEIGVQFGVLSRFLLDEIRPEKLFLFDLPTAQIDAQILSDHRTAFLSGDSSTRLSELPDHSLDWAYVDGDHSFDGVQKDLQQTRRKVKTGGLIIFNDYTTWSVGEVMPYGVIANVNAYVNEGNPVVGFAIPPHGYCDIAVRNTVT